jgi:hypothetical protein
MMGCYEWCGSKMLFLSGEVEGLLAVMLAAVLRLLCAALY